MSVDLDLFIQDFVQTNIVMNTHYDWDSLVNRRHLPTGIRVYEFVSGSAETKRLATAQVIELPDGDWYRIQLTHTIPTTEHTFNCLRMMQANTHTGLTTEQVDGHVLVKLLTRHRGLINIVFDIRPTGLTNSFLV
jgi:hypothetical protein